MAVFKDRVAEKVSLGRGDSYDNGPSLGVFPLEEMPDNAPLRGARQFGSAYADGADVPYVAYTANTQSNDAIYNVAEIGTGKYYKGFNTYEYSVNFASELPPRVANPSTSSLRVGKFIGSVSFNPDGTRLFFVSYGGDVDSVFGKRPFHIYQYDLTTPYDVRTATFDTSYDFQTEFGLGYGINFILWRGDGYGFYTSRSQASNSSKIYGWSLTTPWNVSTASYDGHVGTGSSGFTNREAWFSADGGTYYYYAWVNSAQNRIYKYNLSTPYDLSTRNNSTEYNITPTNFPAGLLNYIHWSTNGDRLFIHCYETDRQFALPVTTPYDIETAVFTDNTRYGADIVSSDLAQGGFTVSNNDNNCYFSENSGSTGSYNSWQSPTTVGLRVHSHSNSNAYIARNPNKVFDGFGGTTTVSDTGAGKLHNFDWDDTDTNYGRIYVAAMPSAKQLMTKDKMIGLASGLGG